MNWEMGVIGMVLVEVEGQTTTPRTCDSSLHFSFSACFPLLCVMVIGGMVRIGMPGT
jgi:hypothetical protein